MPVVFEWKGYKYFFYSNEGTPRERCHIHVRKETAVAKFWLEPEIVLASSWGMSSKELHRVEQTIYEHALLIRSKWNEYFN